VARPKNANRWEPSRINHLLRQLRPSITNLAVRNRVSESRLILGSPSARPGPCSQPRIH